MVAAISKKELSLPSREIVSSIGFPAIKRQLKAPGSRFFLKLPRLSVLKGLAWRGIISTTPRRPRQDMAKIKFHQLNSKSNPLDGSKCHTRCAWQRRTCSPWQWLFGLLVLRRVLLLFLLIFLFGRFGLLASIAACDRETGKAAIWDKLHKGNGR